MSTICCGSMEFDAGDLPPAMYSAMYAAVKRPPTESSTALPAEARPREKCWRMEK